MVHAINKYYTFILGLIGPWYTVNHLLITFVVVFFIAVIGFTIVCGLENDEYNFSKLDNWAAVFAFSLVGSLVLPFVSISLSVITPPFIVFLAPVYALFHAARWSRNKYDRHNRMHHPDRMSSMTISQAQEAYLRELALREQSRVAAEEFEIVNDYEPGSR